MKNIGYKRTYYFIYGGIMKLCNELGEKIKDNQNNSELLMEAVLKEAFASFT